MAALKELEELNDLQSQEDIKMRFADLEKGLMYSILKLQRTTTIIKGDVVRGIKATVSDGGDLKYFTYLPNNFLGMKDTLMEAINESGLTADKFGLCYYGTVGSQNVGRIHPPSEGVNKKLLDDVSKVKSPSSSPMKRAPFGGDGASPSKYSKMG